MEWQQYGTNPELDKLVDSDNWDIRRYVAKQGYGLNVLINDKDSRVRAAIARQRYGLDILINDEDCDVRAAVAEQGYRPDILINDEYIDVYKVCIESDEWAKYCVNNWEILMYHKNEDVRFYIAEQGYGLDVLINDEDWYVREAVQQYLNEHNYKSISDWAKDNSDKVHGEIDFQLTNDIKDFIYKIDESSKLEIQTSCDNIDDFFIIKNSDEFVICTVDTKKSIIKIEKSISDQNLSFKFIVDITNEDGESFSIKSSIKSKEQLNQKIEQTIEYLNQYPKFSKYVEDLERCLL